MGLRDAAVVIEGGGGHAIRRKTAANLQNGKTGGDEDFSLGLIVVQEWCE